MGLTPEDLRALLDAFEASTWQELMVEMDGARLHVSRRSEPGPPPQAGPGSRSDESPATIEEPESARPARDEESDARSQATLASAAVAPSPSPAELGEGANGGRPVTAPSVGLFWRSPSPGATPFVEVGTKVEPDDTVCIIEVMKLMKRIPAGFAGVVTEVLVENGATVEYGQPLILIEPQV